MNRLQVVLLLAVGSAGAAGAQSPTPVAEKLEPRDAPGWRVAGRTIEQLNTAGRSIIRFDERPGAGVAWTRNVTFTDGDIDVDVKGRDLLQKSFVGVMFHATDDTTAEIVWLRPFNFRSTDTARHVHALQYTSYPEFSWQKLRSEHPGMYESAVPAELDPNGWNHLRVSVHGTDVRVYLNRSPTPTLTVRALGPNRSGGVGLWVGDQSNGDFANFTVTPATR
jgi:hypothetical protein